MLPGSACWFSRWAAMASGYAMRRRKKVEKFEDSLVAADAFTANSLFGSTGGQSVDTSNSVFSSNTSGAAVDVHSTEVDPIAEAEVYIAYGREAQAEEILKEALKRQPERQAIRLKLLEIYAGRKDALAFGALAQEMYDLTGGQNEEWPKVVTLGLSIDPANPLYTGEGGMSGSASAAGDAAPAGFSSAAGLAAAAGATAAMLGDRMFPDEEAAARPQEGLTGSFAETVPMDGGVAANEMPSLDFDLDLDTRIGRAASMREDSGAPAEAPASSDSDLSRAIDGRFELPSLELEPGAMSFDDAQSSARALRAEGDEPDMALADLDDFGSTCRRSRARHRARRSTTGRWICRRSAGDLDLSPTTTALAPRADRRRSTGRTGRRWRPSSTLPPRTRKSATRKARASCSQEVVRGGDAAQQQKAKLDARAKII